MFGTAFQNFVAVYDQLTGLLFPFLLISEKPSDSSVGCLSHESESFSTSSPQLLVMTELEECDDDTSIAIYCGGSDTEALRRYWNRAAGDFFSFGRNISHNVRNTVPLHVFIWIEGCMSSFRRNMQCISQLGCGRRLLINLCQVRRMLMLCANFSHYHHQLICTVISLPIAGASV